MCEALPLKRIPRIKFKFKKSEVGYTATYKDYEIHVGANSYWWWDVEYKGNQIAESDFSYKSDAKTRELAIKRAVKALHKWRMNNL